MSFGHGHHFGGSGLNTLQGKPGNCFWVRPQVRELRKNGPWLSHHVQVSLVGKVGEEEERNEEKGKKVKLNLRKHAWLARRRKFVYLPVVGLPLTFKDISVFAWAIF